MNANALASVGVDYAQVFSYDEEGRLTKIERDYGNGNLQTAYEYGYNGDGVRVWKREVLNQQEYRYLCRINCDSVPMRVYNQAIGNASWASVEDYLPAGNALGYGTRWQVEFDTNTLMTAGFGESLQVAIAYQDSFGVDLSSQMTPCVEQVFAPATKQPCPPLGSRDGCEEWASLLAVYTLVPCSNLSGCEYYNCQIVGSGVRECTPQEWDKCRDVCKKKGGKAIGCRVDISGDGKENLVCTCVIDCNRAQFEACKRECRKRGKIAIGCAIIDENGRKQQKCTCFP